MTNLSRLIQVDPRTIWPNEASDFTPWLQDNIKYLEEALGFDIQQIKREAAVGSLSLDLVGEEVSSPGRTVIIENQLEVSNHDHLGKLLTYSAGRKGGVIIWIAPTFRPEHRAALEWLNETTKDNVDFWGVGLKVVKMEGPEVSELRAPDLRVVVRPKTSRAALPGLSPETPSPRNLRYREFFQKLLDKIKEKSSDVTNRTEAQPRSQIEMPTGRGGFRYWLRFTQDKRFHVELHIDLGDKSINKSALRTLESQKDALEEAVGAPLRWECTKNARANKVQWRSDRDVTIDDSQEALEELRGWIVTNFLKFREIFNPYIKRLQMEEGIDEEDEPEAVEEEEQPQVA